jgi:hypothetical protein
MLDYKNVTFGSGVRYWDFYLSVFTDLDYDAIQWAGLSAGVEILNE